MLVLARGGQEVTPGLAKGDNNAVNEQVTTEDQPKPSKSFKQGILPRFLLYI